MGLRSGSRRRALAVAMACVTAGPITAAVPAGAVEAGTPASTVPSGAMSTAEPDPTDPDVLRDAVSDAGSARVLVEFTIDGGLDLEADLTPEGVRAQRRQIAAVRNEIVATLGDDTDVVHAYRTLPAVALEVGAESLESLLDSPDVASVMLDVPVPPTLDYSAPAIEADVARAAGADGDGFAVAILDTGVESAHPLFGGRVVAEACYSTTYAPHGAESMCPGGVRGTTGAGAAADCPTTIYGCGHGTHVAGIAAGGNMAISTGGYAGRTITGVAPAADIIAVQVFSKFPKEQCAAGATQPCALSYGTDQLAGLEYVYGLRNTYDIAAINMSLGGGSYSATCNSGLQTAIANLRNVGIATVIATGNNGYTGTIASPACTEGAIAVGSTFAVGAPSYVSSFTNTDATLTDLYAPGSGILSSYVGGAYARLSGTSMATPQVTGAFAALREQAPGASVDEILSALKTTGVSVSQRRPASDPDWLPATKAYFPSLGFSVPEMRINQARMKLAGTAWKLTLSGTGHGTVASDTYSCTSTCWVPVDSGAAVTLTATPDPGSTFTGWSGGGCSGTGNCAVSPSAATTITAQFSGVANDSFASATAIELAPGDSVVWVDTTGATTEAGETVACSVSGSASVWFTYAAPVSGTVWLTTRNSNYPAIMRVSTGSSIATLASVGCDDGSATWSDGYNNWSQLYTNATLSFSAVAGTTYRIQIGGENGFTGLLKLTLDGPSTASAPAKPTTSIAGDGEVAVTGSAPSGNGYAITGYAARCINGSTVVSATGSTTTVEVAGLTPETTYDCSLRAQTAIGWSPWSRPRAMTAAGVPATPSAPDVSMTGTSVSVTASPPSGRGSPVIGYEARCEADGGDAGTVASSGTTMTLSNLAGGYEYECSVRAENLAGWSAWSSATAASVPGVPTAPSAPSVSVAPATISAVVDTPGSIGSAVFAYEVSCTSPGATTATATGASPSLSVSGLTAGRIYACKMRARNDLGWSPWSATTSVTTPDVPSAPSAPRLTALRKSLRARITAPAANGSPVTSFEIQCKRTGEKTKSITIAAYSVTFARLTSRKRYSCKVRALNAVGWSGWSRAATITPR